ncbi:MAG TPA: Mov34/MPN/PAD-1 family protein [Gemmatimonadaceae bacterium]
MTGVIWLPHEVFMRIAHEATRVAPNETGGVLLGYWVRSADSPGGPEVVVTEAVGPGPGAVHERSWFIPDHAYQEREIARLYEASGRMATYLGDWHAHPDGPAALSTRDLATLRRIASAPAARAPRPIMLLLTGGKPWIAHAWFGVLDADRWRRQLRTVRLSVRAHDP